MMTPGYFGHIRLARPVFYIQYLATVLKILRCVCMKCSKLLIDKNLHRELMSLRPDERWTHVYQLASKVTRCGKETEDGCGCLQPDKKYRKDGLANIFAEWTKVSPGSSAPEQADVGAEGGAGAVGAVTAAGAAGLAGGCVAGAAGTGAAISGWMTGEAGGVGSGALRGVQRRSSRKEGVGSPRPACCAKAASTSIAIEMAKAARNCRNFGMAYFLKRAMDSSIR